MTKSCAPRHYDRKTPSVRFRRPARFGRIDTSSQRWRIVAKPFTQYTEADYAAVLGVNLTGFFTSRSSAIAEMESGIAATSCRSRRA